MNRCKTCKHYQNGSVQMKDCTSPKFTYGYGGRNTSDMEPDEVQVEDDEGWGMIVGPEFGCVHHEAKDDTKNSYYYRSA